MCLILEPDILAAAKLMEKCIWEEPQLKYSISVADCMAKQKQLTEIGLGNVIAEVTSQEMYDFLDKSSVFEYDGAWTFAITESKFKKFGKDCSLISEKLACFVREEVLQHAYPSRVLASLWIK